MARPALTASVAVFFAWGAVLAVSGGLGAGLVATIMHPRFVFMSARTDALMFGRSVRQLYAAEPALEQTVVIYMTMLSAALSGTGIAMAALAWFGLRRGSAGALVALVLTPLPTAAWFLVVLSRYRTKGIDVALADVPPYVWVGALVALVGGLLGWAGLRQTR